MKTKVLQVFYGADALPYKDKERTVHFPIVGNAIQNSNNTTQIKFYFDRLIEENEQATFVAVSKLPNGKIGSKILETYNDEELGEQYALLDLDSFYTQYKGDLFISLQGYQGGVRVEQNEQGIYQIYGTPVIAATGSIKLAINYATSFVGSGETENVTLQQVLGELSTKLGIRQETLHVEELPSEGSPDVLYVVNDDPNNPNLANIYVWNGNTRHYIWVGDNTLNLGNYYTQEQGEQFENDIDNRVASVENELSSVASGSPKGVYATLSALESAFPTGTTGIYVVLADGHWYYWNGSAWTDGGVYLSSSADEVLNPTSINSLQNKSIANALLTLNTGLETSEIKIKAENGWWDISDGAFNGYVTVLYGTQKFNVKTGDIIWAKSAGEKYYLWYGIDGTYLYGSRVDNGPVTVPGDAYWCAIDYAVGTGNVLKVYTVRNPLALARKNQNTLARKYGGTIDVGTTPAYYGVSNGVIDYNFSSLSSTEKFVVKGCSTVRNTNAVSSERYYLFWEEDGTYIGFERKDDYNASVNVPENAYWCCMDYQTSLNVGELKFELTPLSQEETNYDVVCVRNGNAIQVKSPIYGTNKWVGVSANLYGSQNGSFNLTNYYISNNKPLNNEILTTLYKDASDDICPIHYAGSYIGGNHGKEPVFKVVCNSHGKTIADIGSVWEDANSNSYVLYKIFDSNTLGFVGDEVGNSYAQIVITTPSTSLTHTSGATHTENITIGSVSTDQLRPAINHISVKVVNNKDEELTGDGVIGGKYIKVIESYQIMNVPSIVNYLKLNVGNCDNTSYYSDSIPCGVLIENVYRFSKSGAQSICCNVTPVRTTEMDFFGGVQSAPIGNYFYVPFTINDSIEEIPSDQDINFATYRWRDVNFPPYKYYQFDDSNNGFVVGYCIDTEQAKPENRKNICADRAGFYYHPSKKCYPFFYCKNAHPDTNGQSFNFYAFRSPVLKQDNMTQTWYETEDATYMEIEFFASFDDFIGVPEHTLGKTISVIKKTDSVTIADNLLSTGKIKLSCDTKGSITLRFK